MSLEKERKIGPANIKQVMGDGAIAKKLRKCDNRTQNPYIDTKCHGLVHFITGHGPYPTYLNRMSVFFVFFLGFFACRLRIKNDKKRKNKYLT